MLRYASGEAAAFEMLYRRHRGPVLRFIARQVPDRAVAEELFQDVWTSVVRSRDRYTVKARFTTFVYRIAHNRVVDHWRVAGRAAAVFEPGAPEADPPPDSGAPSIERAVHADRQVARLVALVEALPPEQKEAFLLSQEGGLGVEAIAEVTGVGVETAKSRLRYAIAKLRQGLAEEEEAR